MSAAQPSRRRSRATCVSTGNSCRPIANISTHVAVFSPTMRNAHSERAQRPFRLFVECVAQMLQRRLGVAVFRQAVEHCLESWPVVLGQAAPAHGPRNRTRAAAPRHVRVRITCSHHPVRSGGVRVARRLRVHRPDQPVHLAPPARSGTRDTDVSPQTSLHLGHRRRTRRPPGRALVDVCAALCARCVSRRSPSDAVHIATRAIRAAPRRAASKHSAAAPPLTPPYLRRARWALRLSP